MNRSTRAFKKWIAVVVAPVSVGVALVAVAHADSVKNNIVADASGDKVAAVDRGSSVTVNFKVDQQPAGQETGTGENGCNATAASPATLTFSGLPAGTTYSPNPLTMTGCTGFTGVTFTVPGDATATDYPVTVAVSDSGPGSYTTTNAAFKLLVTAPTPPPPSDSTPPAITPHIVGTLGNNGWYVSDVQLSWSVIDNESTVASTTGCDTVLITANQAATNYTCQATSAGGTASETVSIKRDASGPSVTGAPTTSPNVNGWYNGDVTIDWQCSDSPAGLAAGCPGDSTITGEGRGKTAQVTVDDNADNSTTATSDPPVDIDRTGPSVSGQISSSVAHTDGGGNDWYKDAAQLGWTASDPDLADGTDGSGIASGPTPASETLGEGYGQSASSSATDNAGNPGNGNVSGVNVDASGPNVSAAIQSTPAYNDGTDDWYKDSVSIEVAASDPDLNDGHAGSGLGTDPSGTVVRSTSGSFSATAVDNVGHSVDSNTVSYLVDGSNPTVAFDSCPQAVVLGSTATASWTASDTGSGLETASGGSIPLDTSTIGPHSVPAPTAEDNVGHTSDPVSCSYSVVYRWDGFLQPINDTAHQIGTYESKFKLGSTVPVKFQLKDEGGNAQQGGTAPTFAKKRIGATCDSTTDTEASVPTDAISTGSTFRWDSALQGYIYNFSTKGLTAGEWRVYATLDDGATKSVDLCLTK